ncbi:MAG: formylglycine-generating enzyme family protein [Akkermansiaceae bacterium]|nr:formylglycine-generating enzyme family protein [Akkermansiaceae bacterium]MCF7734518.1 formylglycine-generating enzyme family protein [Akkermansiaceae bacterium]
MKHSINSTVGLAVLAGFTLPASAASSIGGGFIDYVTVGNPGNAADSTGYGAVAYEYKIAKNETTIGQYAEFLNAKAKSDPYALYSTSMTTSSINGISRSGSSGSYTYTVNPGSANKPITYVSWFDAARYCNWLQNGQGSGSTETGAYTLNGRMSGIYTMNPGATVWIPSEDEWYKAAYYDATKGGTGGYWPYPTQSNTMGGNTIGVPNSANYYDGDYVGYPGMALTDVGAYGANSDSFYGTNDQGGNVWEWNDAVVFGSSRGLRGGPWVEYAYGLASSYRTNGPPWYENLDVGFRVASVPEPSCVVLTILASGMFVTRRKR